MIVELGYIGPGVEYASSLQYSVGCVVVGSLGSSTCLFQTLISCDGAASLFLLLLDPQESCNMRGKKGGEDTIYLVMTK